MTIYYQRFEGGESRDTLVDGNQHYWASPLTGWSIVTSPVKTGVAAWRCDVDGSQAGEKPLGAGGFGPTAQTLNATWLVLSDTPSATFLLLGEDTDSTIGVECHTDGKLRLVLLGAGGTRWSGRSALTGWSTTALATDDSTFKHVALFTDPLTNGSSNVWFVLQIDDTNQWSVDIGTLPTHRNVFHCPPVGSVDAGIYVTFDDMANLVSPTAGDAPHLTAWPLAEVRRQLATGNDQTDFQNTGGSIGDDDGSFTEWDETTGNDGDTTYNWEVVTAGGQVQSSSGQNAAAIGITGHTVIHNLSDNTAGPAINIVHRVVTQDKFGGETYNNKGGVAGPDIGEPGTSYQGNMEVLTQGGGWVVGDAATLNFGVQIPEGAEHNDEWRITLCMMQWCTYTDTLGLTTAPPVGPTETVITRVGAATPMGLSPGVC